MRSFKHIGLCATVLLISCAEESEYSTRSPLALELYKNGVELMHQFYYSEAKSLLDSAVVVDSTFAIAWGRLAHLNFELRNEDAARLAISAAVRHSTTATLKERLYVDLWNHQISYANDEAMQAADLIIEEFPHDAEAFVAKGRLFEHAALLDSAILFYHRAAELDKGFTRAVMHLGYAYSNAGNQEKAIDYMQRYIRLSPDLADPRASYADLLLRVGRYDEALDQYRRSLELKPDYWYAINQIGYIYQILGRLNDAREQYLNGFSLLPESDLTRAAVYSIDGTIHIKRGEYEKAIEYYNQGLEMDTTSYDAAYGLVYALTLLGETEEAKAVSERIREELENRNLTDSQIMLGFHLMKSRIFTEEERYAEAREACGQALDHATPRSRRVVFRQLAEISIELEEFERAFIECEEALTINPSDPSALLTLARLYRASGNKQMTLAIGNRLLTLWKDADSDFKDLLDLKELLRADSPMPS